MKPQKNRAKKDGNPNLGQPPYQTQIKQGRHLNYE